MVNVDNCSLFYIRKASIFIVIFCFCRSFLMFPYVSLCLRCLHSTMRVMRRRINRINFERLISGVNNIVPCTCRNKNSKSVAYGSLKIKTFLGSSHHSYAVSAFQSDKLVCVRMYFQTNLSANRDTHQRELQMTPCP